MLNKCKLCRAEGQKLFLKGARCYTDKCSISRRQSGPGEHGQMRKKESEYGLQLRAKQKVKRYYGLSEKQCKKYYNKVIKIKEGKTGENMLSLIERRLDNVIYRFGWATSRLQARQLVTHRNFYVNGIQTNIPSCIINVGDSLSLSEHGKKNNFLKEIIAAYATRNHPHWLEFSDQEHYQAKILKNPSRSDIDLEVDETLIVELYSK